MYAVGGEGGEERGSKERTSSGGLVAGGGHPGWGPGIGFAGLATKLLPCGFLSQVRGDHAAGGLGTLQVLWGLQHCGRKWESGLPKKSSSLTSLGETGWWGMASPGYSSLPQELSLEVEPRWPRASRRQQRWVATSERATGGDSC